MSDLLAKGPPQTFLNEVSELATRLVSNSGTAFCLVDPQRRSSSRALRNIDAETDEVYFLDFMSKDPLAPSQYEDSAQTVVSTDVDVPEAALLASSFYKDFMAPRGYRHITDMFFRQNARIIAVLSIVRTAERGPFTTGDLDLLRKVQPFMEYTLNNIFIAGRTATRQSIQERFDLTARETDVVEWVLAGAKNKDISTELGISLPTVKTHLIHIFAKAQVSSRTELLSLIHSVSPFQ